MNYQTLDIKTQKGVAYVMLDRPDVYNAFNELVIEELTHCFTHLSQDNSLYAIVLTGNGRHFCAGADLTWMKKVAEYTRKENIEDSKKMAHMFSVIDTCAKPVIGKINGSAFGGGVGLVAVCDIAVCNEGAQFAFSEVNLGIVPAVISRFVLPKIGVSNARLLFVTGKRFTAYTAHDIGLVHDIRSLEELDCAVTAYLTMVKSSGPKAVKAAKDLIQTWLRNISDFPDYTAQLIAELRASEEGKEGISAFLEKRKPEWR
jgi:methylglutaconyl-CoA hydratase